MSDTKETEETPPMQSPPDPDVPDFYVDGFTIGMSPFTVVLEFGVRQVSGIDKPVVRLRMSPQHAKAMVMAFRKGLKSYEAQWGDVPLPQAILEQVALSTDTDW